MPGLPRIAQRRQGIDRLPRLRNEQGGTLAAGPFGARQGRFAVAEFRRDIDLDRDAGQLFEPVLGRQAGVIGRAAGDQSQAVQFRWVERQVRHGHRPRRRVDEALQRVADDLGLFVDFLQHEVAVAALADGRPRKFRPAHGPFDRLVVGVEDFRAVGPQDDPIAVLQVHDPIGQGGERQGVGS